MAVTAPDQPNAAILSDTRSRRDSLGYLPVIDGLRGIAIILVLWSHAPWLLSKVESLPEPGFWRMSTGGWIGVDLFFVVSGFLITTILLRTRGESTQLRIFWARRALRILPLAFLYLLVVGLQPTLGNPWGVLDQFEGWAWYYMYLANVYIAQHGFQPLCLMILWSLAVEEQFYVVWPLVVRKLNSWSLVKVCIWIGLLCPLMRALTIRYPAAYVLTSCRADTLAAGAILALLLNDARLRAVTLERCRQLSGVALVVLAVVLIAPFSPSFPSTHPFLFTVFGYSLIAASFVVLVGASLTATGWIRVLLCQPILRYVGKLCYGFYIWHCFVGAVVADVCAEYFSGVFGFGAAVCLWVVCTTLVASASWFLFEKPILNLKRLVPHQPEPFSVRQRAMPQVEPHEHYMADDIARTAPRNRTPRQNQTSRLS